MKLYLITLVHEHDEGTVVSPIVVPAESKDEAESLADRIADRFGIGWEDIDEIGEF